jgi:hypothetical protein
MSFEDALQRAKRQAAADELEKKRIAQVDEDEEELRRLRQERENKRIRERLRQEREKWEIFIQTSFGNDLVKALRLYHEVLVGGTRGKVTKDVQVENHKLVQMFTGKTHRTEQRTVDRSFDDQYTVVTCNSEEILLSVYGWEILYSHSNDNAMDESVYYAVRVILGDDPQIEIAVRYDDGDEEKFKGSVDQFWTFVAEQVVQ